MDQFGLERIVHLRPQAAHHDVHNIRIGFESDVPYLFCDFSAGYDFSGRASQMSEEKKFLRRETERHAGTRCLVPPRIEFQIIDAQRFCPPLGSTPQYRAYPGEQFRKRERLYQVIVRTQLESFHPVAHAVARSKKKNGRANAVASQFRDYLPAVLVWQHDIDDEKVEPGRAGERQTGFAIPRKIDSEAGFAQTFGEKGGRFSFVLDQQNSHCLQVYKPISPLERKKRNAFLANQSIVTRHSYISPDLIHRSTKLRTDARCSYS